MNLLIERFHNSIHELELQLIKESKKTTAVAKQYEKDLAENRAKNETLSKDRSATTCSESAGILPKNWLNLNSSGSSSVMMEVSGVFSIISSLSSLGYSPLVSTADSTGHQTHEKKRKKKKKRKKQVDEKLPFTEIIVNKTTQLPPLPRAKNNYKPPIVRRTSRKNSNPQIRFNARGLSKSVRKKIVTACKRRSLEKLAKRVSIKLKAETNIKKKLQQRLSTSPEDRDVPRLFSGGDFIVNDGLIQLVADGKRDVLERSLRRNSKGELLIKGSEMFWTSLVNKDKCNDSCASSDDGKAPPSFTLRPVHHKTYPTSV